MRENGWPPKGRFVLADICVMQVRKSQFFWYGMFVQDLPFCRKRQPSIRCIHVMAASLTHAPSSGAQKH